MLYFIYNLFTTRYMTHLMQETSQVGDLCDLKRAANETGSYVSPGAVHAVSHKYYQIW